MHPWVGAGDDDRLRILHELGLESIDQLFASIPSEICVDLLELPTARDEETVRLALSRMSTANLSIDCAPSFLGAGVYRGADLRKLDVHDLTELVLRVLGDADHDPVVLDTNPLVGAGIQQISRYGHLGLLLDMWTILSILLFLP